MTRTGWVAHSLPAAPDDSGPGPSAVQRSIDHLRRHLDEPLRLADHAHAGNYSPYHFHRLFLESTGTTPGRFLMAERMAEAKQLLAHTGLLVCTVQRTTGYASLGTFTTQFTRAVGVSPGAFRRLIDSTAGTRLSDALPPDRRSIGIPFHNELGADWVTVAGRFADGCPEGIPDLFGLARALLAFAVPSDADLSVLGLPAPGVVQVACASIIGPGLFAPRLVLRPPRGSDPAIVTAAGLLAVTGYPPTRRHLPADRPRQGERNLTERVL